MKQIKTIGIENEEYTFQYEIERDEIFKEIVTFRIYSIPLDRSKFSMLRVKISSKGNAMVDMVSHQGNEEFGKKGIPERIIQEASEELKVNIISSPVVPKADRYLTENSKKVWERLINENINAKFDQELGCYVLKYCK